MKCQWCECELDEDSAFETEGGNGPFCDECVEDAQVEEDSEQDLAHAA